MKKDTPPADAIAALRAEIEGQRFDAARRDAERLLKDYPDAPALLVLAGTAAYLDGDLAAAEPLLERALKLDRNLADAHHALGNLHHDLGRADKAISAYRRAIRLDPVHAGATNDLGTAYFAKGWLHEAEECFREAVRLRPDDPDAAQNLGATLRKQGKASEARKVLQRALWLRLTRRLKRKGKRKS